MGKCADRDVEPPTGHYDRATVVARAEQASIRRINAHFLTPPIDEFIHIKVGSVISGREWCLRLAVGTEQVHVKADEPTVFHLGDVEQVQIPILLTEGFILLDNLPNSSLITIVFAPTDTALAGNGVIRFLDCFAHHVSVCRVNKKSQSTDGIS